MLSIFPQSKALFRGDIDMSADSETDTKAQKGRANHSHIEFAQKDEETGGSLEGAPTDRGESFPDGGFQAWRTALGGFLSFVASIGFLSGGSVFQSYFKTTVLPGSSTSDIAWIGSVQVWGCYFFGIWSGALSDKHGPALPLAVGTFFMVLGNMMSSVSTKFYQFLLSQGFCVALGMGFIFTPALAIQSQWFLKRRGFAVGFVMSGQMAGGIIWPVLANRLLNFEGMSYGWTLRIIGFMQLGIMVAAILLVQRRFPCAMEQRPMPLKQYFTDRSTMLLTFAIFLMNLGIYVPWFYITPYAIQRGASASLGFYDAAILNAGAFFGCYALGMIADSGLGFFNSVIVATFVCAVISFAWIGSHGIPGVVVWAVAYGMISGALQAIFSPCVSMLAPTTDVIGFWNDRSNYRRGRWDRLRTITPDCEILHDPQDPQFHERLSCWTDIDRKTPTASILPRSEHDCLKTVKWALQSSIPLVTTCGDHSTWSTTGVEGIIIDLSGYVDVRVDAERKAATLVGGDLSKQVGMRLAEAGLFTAFGNDNMVGVNPYFLGRGASIISSITGVGSDQIVSARVITAQDGGKLAEVTEKEHSDLLWALQGAWQFFGLVTQLTIRAHRISQLLKQQGLIWTGAFIFLLERATEIAPVMKRLMADSQRATAGLNSIPGHRRAVPFQVLYDLHPLVATGDEAPIQHASDAREALCGKGDLKQFGVVGLHGFDAEGFVRTIDTWKQMVHDCPDAINTGFNVQRDARAVKTPEVELAMSLYDIPYWQNNLIWHTEEWNHRKVEAYNNECISIMRGDDQSHSVDFQNGTRVGPIERRYRGQAHLEKRLD
ncbi:monocarboxylate transporter [Aspergillus bombycis]|uniref:Monocarboxylate transporter n=1 Tax=Aspergillus bombycis TaxID=109264 RepID=A0A1F7ZMV8_9EURO|nr:monocarboxylate transporter [Aspergillus bombycis]OGM40774.1 monocarboxylate transporter [Aspergillus bombycis]